MTALLRSLLTRGRALLRLTEDDARAEVRSMLRRGAPDRVLIDVGLPPGSWYVVRAPHGAGELCVLEATQRGQPGWEETVQL